jgi:ankyrin repeat protein
MNPMLRHDPADFYSGDDLKAAEAIRKFDQAALTAVLLKEPKVAASRGRKDLPLLAWAMGHNNPPAGKLLLQAGAPPDDFIRIKTAKMSLLSVATGAERDDFFKLLLSHRADPNGPPDTDPPIFTAVYTEKFDRFDRLLEAGADANRTDGAGKTILMVLAMVNEYERALKLVDRGADVNARMNNGTTLAEIVREYPLPPDTVQGRAQEKLRSKLR